MAGLLPPFETQNVLAPDLRKRFVETSDEHGATETIGATFEPNTAWDQQRVVVGGLDPDALEDIENALTPARQHILTNDLASLIVAVSEWRTLVRFSAPRTIANVSCS